MFQVSRGVYGAAAIALALGAIPLAAGRDLADGAQLLLTSAASNVTRDAPASAVNRDAKADRSARTMGAPSDTISLRLDDLPGTSVLVRLPAKSARDGSSTKSGSGRPKVACEPVVSVLTEVAKLLQPGRCVT
ncbi:MAG: hypothetical protein ACJ8EK_02925 [Bradyrhizobium sp.]